MGPRTQPARWTRAWHAAGRIQKDIVLVTRCSDQFYLTQYESKRHVVIQRLLVSLLRALVKTLLHESVLEAQVDKTNALAE